jgi:hypothetical protein
MAVAIIVIVSLDRDWREWRRWRVRPTPPTVVDCVRSKRTDDRGRALGRGEEHADVHRSRRRRPRDLTGWNASEDRPRYVVPTDRDERRGK